MNDCLSHQELEGLRSGTLSAEDADRASRHIAQCRSCGSRLDETIEVRTPAPVETIEVRTPTPVETVDSDATLPGTLRTAPPPAPEEGAETFPRIEGYEIHGVLGRGGMGVVYRAVQKNLRRVVALKVLPIIAGSTHPNVVARFRREATAAARLHHTNIIPVYDFGEVGHALYYAMELIEGEPLSDLIPRQADAFTAAPPSLVTGLWRRGTHSLESPSAVKDDSHADEAPAMAPFPAAGETRPIRAYYRDVSRWMIDAADALAYAHEEDVIHRDIKPANLILSRDRRIMIADFGLAKTSDDNTMTQAGSFLGTLRYASPEQARGQDVDHRTDIYSLGVTMYELLCFRPAYPMTGQKEMLHAILEKDPTPPRRVQPAIPAEMETICLKAMEKSPAMRYASARDMADDLRRHLNDLPIAAKRPNVIQRARKFVRRHKVLVTVVTAVLLITVSSLITVRARADRRRAEVERYYESGMYWSGQNNWAAAENDFRAALNTEPNHVQTMLAMVWMNIERHKNDPSFATPAELERLDRLCQRVLDIDPTQVTALNYRSVLLKNLRRYDEAIAVTRRVIGLYPDYFAAHSNLGAFLALTGDIEGAVESLAKGATLAEQTVNVRAVDLATVMRNLAAAELLLKRPEAFEHIDRALRSQPHDQPAWLLRIRARLTLDGYVDLAEALDDAKHADRLALGRSARAKRFLAHAHLSNGQYEAAATEARAALQLGSPTSATLLILAAAEAELGHIESAREHLQRATEALPAALEAQPFIASFDEGVLWFETAEELIQLRALADSALENR